MKYKIRIGEKEYDLQVENHYPQLRLFHEGKPVHYDLEVIRDPNLYSLILDGKHYRIWIEKKGNGTYQLFLDHQPVAVEVEDERGILRRLLNSTRKKAGGNTQVKAPMPGLVVKIEVEVDEIVKEGQGMVVIEAMKMENEIRAPIAGRVKKIFVKQGQAIDKDAVLAEISEPEP